MLRAFVVASCALAVCASCGARRPAVSARPTAAPIAPAARPRPLGEVLLATMPAHFSHAYAVDLRGAARADALDCARVYLRWYWSFPPAWSPTGADPLAGLERVVEGSWEADLPYWLSLITGEAIDTLMGARTSREATRLEVPYDSIEETPFGRALVLENAMGDRRRARLVWSEQLPSLAENAEFRALGPSEDGAFVALWASGSNSERSGTIRRMYGARIARFVARTLGDESLFDDAFLWTALVRLEVVARGGGRLDHVITTLQLDDAAALEATARVRARWASQLDALEARLTRIAPREPARVLAAVPAFVSLARREARIDAVGRAVRIVVPDNGILAALMEGAAADELTQQARRDMAYQAERNLDAMARAATALIAARTARGAAPAVPFANAPRTPAEVPRGDAPTPPEGTWRHATWRALGFAPDGPNRFSYEVEVRGPHVCFRAYGDLNGDGYTSTLEVCYAINRAGVFEYVSSRAIHRTE